MLFSRCHKELLSSHAELVDELVALFMPPRSILQGPPRVGGWARMFPEIWAFRNPIFTIGRRMRKRKLHHPIVIVILPFLLCFVLLLPIGFDMFWHVLTIFIFSIVWEWWLAANLRLPPIKTWSHSARETCQMPSSFCRSAESLRKIKLNDVMVDWSKQDLISALWKPWNRATETELTCTVCFGGLVSPGICQGQTWGFSLLKILEGQAL